MPVREAVGLLYEGDVYLRRWVAGVLNDEIIGPIEGTKLAIQANNEVKPRFSKRRDQHGKKVGSVSQGRPSTGSLAFSGVDPDLMAILFLGTNAALNISGSTVTGEVLNLPHDKWVKLAQRNVTLTAIVASVLGTDFLENKRIGAIKALSTGNLVDDAAATIDYTYSGITGNIIDGGTDSTVEVEVIMDGRNLEDLTDAYVRIPRISLTPSAELDLLADDYVDGEFSGEMEKLDAESAEFYLEDNVTYA